MEKEELIGQLKDTLRVLNAGKGLDPEFRRLTILKHIHLFNEGADNGWLEDMLKARYDVNTEISPPVLYKERG